jgi:hypothetical protein
MAIIPAVITRDARKYWPQFFGTLLGIGTTTTVGTWNPLIKKFKIGEGGWVNPGPTVRDPDPALQYNLGPKTPLQDLDALIDATRDNILYAPDPVRYPALPANGRGSYTKLLGPGDFTFESPSVVRVRCFLDIDEFNENTPGSGVSPQLWEIGLFSDHPERMGEDLMVVYGTFPVEIKTSAAALENSVRIIF